MTFTLLSGLQSGTGLPLEIKGLGSDPIVLAAATDLDTIHDPGVYYPSSTITNGPVANPNYLLLKVYAPDGTAETTRIQEAIVPGPATHIRERGSGGTWGAWGEAGGGLDQTAVDARITALRPKATDSDIDTETSDTAYTTVAKVFRAIGRKVSDTRLLPSLPGAGSRDNKVPKFDGNTLGWETDAGGLDQAAVDARVVALRPKATDNQIDAESSDTAYTTVLKVFRAIARKVKNASTTVRGIVIIARNEDVDSSESDTTRVLDVAKGKRLIQRIAAVFPAGGAAGEVLKLNQSTLAREWGKIQALNMAADSVGLTELNAAATARLLPTLPEEGSRDNKVPKFDGNTLGWEVDATTAGGSGLDETAVDGRINTLRPASRQLPSLPGAGSRDNKVPKFDGNTLGWETDAGGLDQAAVDARVVALRPKATDNQIDAESSDTAYTTVLKVFRAIARKVKNASTTVRGIVIMARNADVDASESDTTRALDVAKGKRLIERLVPSWARTATNSTRLLPAFPATGARNDKVPKFDGNTLGWEEDASGIDSDTEARADIDEMRDQLIHLNELTREIDSTSAVTWSEAANTYAVLPVAVGSTISNYASLNYNDFARPVYTTGNQGVANAGVVVGVPPGISRQDVRVRRTRLVDGVDVTDAIYPLTWFVQSSQIVVSGSPTTHIFYWLVRPGEGNPRTIGTLQENEKLIVETATHALVWKGEIENTLSPYHYRKLFDLSTKGNEGGSGALEANKIGRTDGGKTISLISSQTVGGGLKPSYDFITEWEGFIIGSLVPYTGPAATTNNGQALNANETVTVNFVLEFTHSFGSGPTTFTSRRTYTFVVQAGDSFTIPMSVFSSRSQLQTGTYVTRDGTTITVTQADLDANLTIAYSLNIKAYQGSNRIEAALGATGFNGLKVTFLQDRFVTGVAKNYAPPTQVYYANGVTSRIDTATSAELWGSTTLQFASHLAFSQAGPHETWSGGDEIEDLMLPSSQRSVDANKRSDYTWRDFDTFKLTRGRWNVTLYVAINTSAAGGTQIGLLKVKSGTDDLLVVEGGGHAVGSNDASELEVEYKGLEITEEEEYFYFMSKPRVAISASYSANVYLILEKIE